MEDSVSLVDGLSSCQEKVVVVAVASGHHHHYCQLNFTFVSDIPILGQSAGKQTNKRMDDRDSLTHSRSPGHKCQ